MGLALNTPKSKLLLLSVLLLLLLAFHALRSKPPHPIFKLLADAADEHARRTSERSTTVDQAYAKYRRRHGRDPPLGFDKWFETAQRVETCRVDGFDELYESLRVWWAVSPREIRDRMEQLPPIKGMGRIRIRHGAAITWDEIEREQEGLAGEDSDARRAMHLMLEAVMQDFNVQLPDRA
jgi:hypothetical protein